MTEASRPLRVLHLLPHARALGGTERTVVSLMDAAALGHVEQRVAFAQPGRVLGFDPARVLGGTTGPARGVPAALRLRPDVVHGWLLQGNLYGALLKRLRPTVLIASERHVGNVALPRLKQELERIVTATEDVAVGNSRAVRDAAIARHRRRAGHFRVILPGVEAPPADGPPALSTAVMVGRLHEVKDHETALRVWRRVVDDHPDATLAIVGGGARLDVLRQLAQDVGIGAHVEFDGESDPGARLRGARLFLCTSQGEGFSRATMEALAAGLPVVSTAVGGIDELEGDAVRIAAIGDDATLAGHVSDWLADPSRLRHAAESARRLSERFAPDRCAQEYADLYAALGRRTAPGA